MIKKHESSDYRHPELEKVGCFFSQGKDEGFQFFKPIDLSNNDIFIYNKGILWRVRR